MSKCRLLILFTNHLSVEFVWIAVTSGLSDFIKKKYLQFVYEDYISDIIRVITKTYLFNYILTILPPKN